MLHHELSSLYLYSDFLNCPDQLPCNKMFQNIRSIHISFASDIRMILSFLLSLVSLASTRSAILCPSDGRNQNLLIQSFHERIQSNGCPENNLFSSRESISGSGESSRWSYDQNDYTICCDQQQICYQICGLTKNYCDEDFKFCLSQLCENIQGVDQSHACELHAHLLFQSILYSNYEEYEDYQTKFCQCVAEEKDEEGEGEVSTGVDSQYLHFFQNFYRKYAPEKLSKGMALIQREIQRSHEQLLTYRKLFYELHKKYESAVSYTERRKRCTSYPRLGESWAFR